MPRKKPPKRQAYDTDLSDDQWALIDRMIPQAAPGGRPRKATKRELVDAILYSCVPVVAGVSCLMTCHRGRRSTTISAAGSERACGIGSTMRS